MMVMPSNNSGARVHYLAGRHPGKIGHLYSPGGERGPYPWIPYALDNGAYAAWSRGEDLDLEAFFALCEWAKNSDQQPRWVVIPDAPMNARQTLKMWDELSGSIRATYGWPLAVAVQDGMECSDAPQDADVIFVGGSNRFKAKSVWLWCQKFDRVHVGRVNSPRLLYHYFSCGVESVDGTGWFRGDVKQLAGLEAFLENPERERFLFSERTQGALKESEQ